MILFDSSVWIDALRGKNNSQVKLLSDSIMKNEMVSVCPLIVQEVLQGISDNKQFKEIKDNFKSFIRLKIPSYSVALETAKLYRHLRKKGVTVKSSDCVISVFAIHFGIPIVHNDRDFDLIAKHSNLKILK